MAMPASSKPKAVNYKQPVKGGTPTGTASSPVVPAMKPVHQTPAKSNPNPIH